MTGNFKCLNCGSRLDQRSHNNSVYWNCRQCASNYAGLAGFADFLIEHEYHRLVHEVAAGKVLSQKNCPCCAKRMVLVLDLARSNQVEACSACRLVWLDPGEGLKIAQDQALQKDFKPQMVLPREPELPPSLNGDDLYYDLDDRSFRRTYGLTNAAASLISTSTVKLTFLEKLSKKNPVLGFIVMIILICAVLSFCKSFYRY